ncbi:MAG: DUF1874 domain-containing protein [Chitinophagaceae bacterium]
MLTILNSSVLTTFGEYSYRPLTIEDAKTILKDEGFVSAIGHNETANLFSSLTGMDIKANRVEYRQQPGEKALIFKIRKRLKVAEVVGPYEIPPEEYECGILIRKS